ncbi:MAG: hypothetical protein EBW11_03215 [Betaproteobacteria bacterium]|nr:hypothetical protein [Betaproteobacteria bacterium]
MSAFQARLLLIDEQAQRAFFSACTSEKAELIAALAKSIDECPKVLNAEPHALDAQQTLAAVLKGCDRSDRWSLADRFPTALATGFETREAAGKTIAASVGNKVIRVPSRGEDAAGTPPTKTVRKIEAK